MRRGDAETVAGLDHRRPACDEPDHSSALGGAAVSVVWEGIRNVESGHDVSNRLVPRAFGDLRGWIEALEREGELHTIDAEVDWDCELGTIARKAFGQGEAQIRRSSSRD